MTGRQWIAGKISIVWLAVVLTAAVAADQPKEPSIWSQFAPLEAHGFYEIRGGYRLQNDRYEKDMSVMESRFQLDLYTYNDWAEFKYKGDVYGDLTLEKGRYQTRETWISFQPTEFMDVKLGRQILTWGTGDMLFINDLFPKDWQSYFLGRQVEYLKAPSDAVKISIFSDLANLDVVYTPQFDSDSHIKGEYISYWNQSLGRTAGRDAIVHTDKPDRWFQDDEIALRLYKNINNYEYALYGYRGFWKSPAGMNSRGQALFPDLNVYGASVRGQVGKGIGNAEIGYYQSCDDESGRDPMIDNSEMRYLVGYTQEIAPDFTGGVQYYLEQMLGYDEYKKNSGSTRDEYRHVVTLRLTRLLMNQNLTLSFFGYYSPSDKDAYLRPHVHYKASDHLGFEVGSNIFFGDYRNTFFGQFRDNTHLYTAVRYSF
ncbi:MAG TPA: hypothetical protein PLQ45_04055 [Anaerohalosphaeraceae bacterium]|jgi:hypothetical protein|nr:hypothetical protein [Anaerohalosphaeraceae bacterium]